MKTLLSIIGVTLTLAACSSNQPTQNDTAGVASPSTDVQQSTPNDAAQAPIVQ